MANPIPNFPILFEYDNYRKFVEDAFLALKARDKIAKDSKQLLSLQFPISNGVLRFR